VASFNIPEKGQVVRLKGGQFSGIDAIYQEPDGETRSIMLVKMISQVIPMSIDNKHLELDS
ncbi:transcriptional activator RfaH, partial [Vibrio sp. V01_P9A10T6]